MNSSDTDLAVTASSKVLSEYFCPVEPIHIWVLTDRTMFKVTATITIILFPVVGLLNVLVILAVKTKRELKEHNSNILLASLAIADVLTGIISMPLAVTLDVLLLLKRFLEPDVFCVIALINEMMLFIGGCSSTYHLAVIAWERYVAIRKLTEYKVIVTKGRVTKYARIAWLVAVLVAVPPRVMKMRKYFEVPYKYYMIVSLVGVIPGAVAIILIGYFYILVYLGVRKRNVAAITEVRSLITAKLATKVAKTTAILTGAVFISFIPSAIYLFFGEAYPVFRRSSYFRWSMMLAHLNSVFNPVLYCYRDRRYRVAMLEILKIRKPAPVVKKKERRNDSIKSLEDPREKDRKPRLRSCGSIRDLPNTDEKTTKGKVKWERRSSALSCETSRVVRVDTHYRPRSMRTKPEEQVKGTRHDKITEMTRSKSLDERALARMIGSQCQYGQKATRRAKTAPSMERSMTISEYELGGFKRKPGPEVESSVTTIGVQSLLEDTSSKFQASRYLVSLKPSSPLPKSSRNHEMTRSNSLPVAGHEYQQKKRILGHKRALSASRNKEMATSKLTGQTALTRKPHLNVNSGVTTKGSQSHDLEDHTKQLHASSFQAALHAQSSSLRLKGSRHQYQDGIKLESLDEHDPFEMEMESAQNSAGSDSKTQDIVLNFSDQQKGSA